ncbi:fluoride efflux transporter CrcB [Aegicerativicinus sediminis]|uniref:fluoride efflux transporter CrcB n=1 Tax=Aegicerativicinus sediminis TaxID=2893202 RepID=UPI001E475EE1|nr:fluoride efflux transporter CrcB [Aegicerativicinus sediminis]
MKNFLLVFLGGGIGSGFRYLLSLYLNSHKTGIPYGTFLANIIGSFLIGLILGWVAKNTHISHQYTLILAVGFCGGFTTFSTFAYENHVLLRSGDLFNFALYTLGSLVVGFLAVFFGMFLVR